MILSRAINVLLGLLLWVGVILLFKRHDLLFYILAFLFSAAMTFLSLSEKAPRFVEARINEDV